MVEQLTVQKVCERVNDNQIDILHDSRKMETFKKNDPLRHLNKRGFYLLSLLCILCPSFLECVTTWWLRESSNSKLAVISGSRWSRWENKDPLSSSILLSIETRSSFTLIVPCSLLLSRGAILLRWISRTQPSNSNWPLPISFPPWTQTLISSLLKKTLFKEKPVEKVEVLLRVCPIFNDEESVVHDATGNTIEIINKDSSLAEYSFDSIFDESVSQESIFQVPSLFIIFISSSF